MESGMSAENTEAGAVGPMTLFVVVGTCGEYSDRREWLARAFCEEKTAQTFADRLKHDGTAIYAKKAAVGRYTSEADEIEKTALDPKYDDDYTGPPDYTVAPVPLGLPSSPTGETAPSQERADSDTTQPR